MQGPARRAQGLLGSCPAASCAAAPATPAATPAAARAAPVAAPAAAACTPSASPDAPAVCGQQLSHLRRQPPGSLPLTPQSSPRLSMHVLPARQSPALMPEQNPWSALTSNCV